MLWLGQSPITQSGGQAQISGPLYNLADAHGALFDKPTFFQSGIFDFFVIKRKSAIDSPA